MNTYFTHLTDCQICGHTDLVKVLDLGSMPPANNFLTKEELSGSEEKFPLVAYFCTNCHALQLLDIVDPAILFKHYAYLTSASRPLVVHFEEMGRDMVSRFVSNKEDLVVEIGGNDAVLLGAIKDNCRTLNVEPAENVAVLSREKGIETMSEFFNKAVADSILEKYGPAKVVIANNVMAHIAGIKSVFEGVKHLIGEDGVFVFEVHWVGNLLNEGGFDQIYHEHLFYHSLLALNNLVDQFGLKIFDVEMVPIHGQSMRVFVSKNMPVAASVAEHFEHERALGLDKAETFLKFSEKVEKNKSQLISLLKDLKAQGKKIVGYGAPAKGNTLLNYFGIDGAILDYIIDTTPLKQGMYTPGMHVEVKSPTALQEEVPDYILLLAWNYADAILEKEKPLRDRGIKFIIPVPEVRIV